MKISNILAALLLTTAISSQAFADLAINLNFYTGTANTNDTGTFSITGTLTTSGTGTGMDYNETSYNSFYALTASGLPNFSANLRCTNFTGGVTYASAPCDLANIELGFMKDPMNGPYPTLQVMLNSSSPLVSGEYTFDVSGDFTVSSGNLADASSLYLTFTPSSGTGQTATVSNVPEASTSALFAGLGALGFIFFRRRKTACGK